MKARVTAYRYNGPHRNWNQRTHMIDPNFDHWDWRYKIVSKTGVTLHYRQGFHSWSAAWDSMCLAWRRLDFAVRQESL